MSYNELDRVHFIGAHPKRPQSWPDYDRRRLDPFLLGGFVDFQEPSSLDAVTVRQGVGRLLVSYNLGDGGWCRLDLDQGVGRSSQRRKAVGRALAVYPAHELTGVGGNLLNSPSTGVLSAHVGRSAYSMDGPGDYLEGVVEVGPAGLLYVSYMGRNPAGHVRVDIDGSQALVNELEDLGNGYKAFDSETPVDLTRRQLVLVASGLAPGSYTVRCSNEGDFTTSDDRIYIEAFLPSMAASTVSRADAPAWEPGLTVVAGQELVHNGYYYATRTAGTTAEPGPSHTSGVGACGGGIDYNVWTESSYFPTEVEVDYASEREYALNIDVNGTLDDVGGQTHGNETGAEEVRLDGVPVTPGDVVLQGSELTVTGRYAWSHAEDASLADADVSRIYKPGELEVRVSVRFSTTSADVGWFYDAMMPFLVYSSSGDKLAEELRLDTGQTYALDDFPGGPTDVTLQGVRGMKTTYTIEGKRFEQSVTKLEGSKEAYLRLNVNSGTVGNNWQGKGYFQEATTVEPLTVGDATVLQWHSKQFDRFYGD